MNLWLGLLIGLKEIWAHKFRSFLTMLGVILGVASLLSMFSLTAGIAKGMRDYMQQVGGLEKVNVIPQDPPMEQEGYAEISPGRTLGDAEAIARSCPLVSRVAPTSEIASAAISRSHQVFRSPVVGTWPDFIPVNKHELERGRSLSALDIENVHRVCVIGQSVARKLWPERSAFNPLGESILINGRPFTVVGQFRFYEREEDKRQRELGAKTPKSTRPTKAGAPRGSSPFERKNNAILIPITTMFYEFKSANVVNKEDQGPNLKLDQLSIQVADTTRFDETLAQVHEVVLANHRGIEDFMFDTKQEWFDAIEQNVRNTRLSGAIIAGISLLVGGIRDHQHHAGQYHRADPRNWSAPGRGSEEPGHLRADRRRERFHRLDWRVPGPDRQPGRDAPSDGGFPRRKRAGNRVEQRLDELQLCRGDRRGQRVLSRAQSQPIGSDLSPSFWVSPLKNELSISKGKTSALDLQHDQHLAGGMHGSPYKQGAFRSQPGFGRHQRPFVVEKLQVEQITAPGILGGGLAGMHAEPKMFGGHQPLLRPALNVHGRTAQNFKLVVAKEPFETLKYRPEYLRGFLRLRGIGG